MRNYAVWSWLLIAFASSTQAQLTLADRILWPHEGYFLAYPVEEEDPYDLKVSASSGYTYDDNLFRLSDDEDPQTLTGESGRSDTIRRIGAGVKWDIPVSRQLFRLDARADNYYFDRFSFLDHTAYDLGAIWQYRAGPLVSGDLGYRRSLRLNSFAGTDRFTEVQERIRDLITRDYGYVSGGYRFHPRFRARGQVTGELYSYSEPSREVLDARITTETIGLDYITRSENTFGLQLQLEQGSYPNRQVVASSTVDNEYDEYELSAVVGWQLAPKTRFDARLGYTDRNHDQVPERDFSGPTYRAGIGYAPSAKILLDLVGYHELTMVEELIASAVLTEGVVFGAAWAPTIKTVLQAKTFYETREYEGDPGFVLDLNQQRDDEVRGARFTAGYKPLRVLDLWVAYEHGRRTSNVNNVEYDYNLVSANVGIRF